MGKIAFLFSGQGAQAPGMGKSFYESIENVKTFFDECEMVFPGILEKMFGESANADELRDTKLAQPCLYLCDLAAAMAVKQSGITPDAVCGFSLGEIPALAFANVYDTKTGFELVCKRGEAMAKAAQKNPASMCAVVKLSNADVLKACNDLDGVYPVNFNCEGQVSVAYKTEMGEALEKSVRALGGRVLPLKVSGGFHSPFMDEAALEFEKVLSATPMSDPSVTVYSNVTARPYDGHVADTLSKQINTPVRWEETIKHLHGNGFDTFVETGVGNVLQKLVTKTLPEAKSFAVSDMETLASTLEVLKQ